MQKMCLQNLPICKTQTNILARICKIYISIGRAFSSNFWKRPKLGKKKSTFKTSKLGEIDDIEHNKGSKIYPQNQVILDCTIRYFKHTFLSTSV